jgi:hypothetical protein
MVQSYFKPSEKYICMYAKAKQKRVGVIDHAQEGKERSKRERVKEVARKVAATVARKVAATAARNVAVATARKVAATVA